MTAPTRTVIRIGAAPSRFDGRAVALDGRNAEPLDAHLRIDESAAALVVTLPGRAPWVWPLSEVRRLPGLADPDDCVLARQGHPLPRLVVTEPEVRRILTARCTDLHRRPRPRGLARLAAWAVAAVGAVALIVLVLVPLLADRLAALLPPEGEQALGKASLEQVRAALDRTGVNPLPICDGVDGVAALSVLSDRLTDGADLPYDVTVSVLDHPLVNAFALPGGQVVFFRGLIDAAQTPEELAAVFAHELGHVAARDPARIALRSAGSIGVLGLLLGDFAGGAIVLLLTEQLIRASYTQEAETAADAFAVARLRDTGLPPAALAAFFERLRAQHGNTSGVVAHFLSHPEMGDRIAAVAGAAPPDVARAALAPAQWDALKAICGSSPVGPY